MSQPTLSSGFIFHERYQITRAIRSGGMGEVYRAIDLNTGMAVAIKRMLVEAYALGADESAQYQAQRFEEECKLLKNLNLAGVPAFVDSFLDGDRRVIVMEFIEGIDLEKQVSDQQALTGITLTALTAVTYAIEVAKILEFLHVHRPRPIIHRDVKPANIIVRTEDSAIYLVDFGLAREVGSAFSTKTAVGTVGYAPLEQYRGRPTTRTDQYSLGVTLHYLLSGQPPLPLQVSPLDTIQPPLNLPHELCWVVRKATQEDQEDRFDSIREFRLSLENLIPALEQRERDLLLAQSNQTRMALLGPTEELEEEEEKPLPRPPAPEVFPEVPQALTELQEADAFQEQVSRQQEFQRQSLQAEQQPRGRFSESDWTQGDRHRTRVVLALMLLLLGILALYLLNRRQQRQMAEEIVGSKALVVEAHGFRRGPKGLELNSRLLGGLEAWLSFPRPRNDGLKATLKPGVSRLEFFHSNEEESAYFLAAALGLDDRVLSALWLRADHGQWWKASTPYVGISLDFNYEFQAQINWVPGQRALLDCSRARSVVLLLPPQDHALQLQPLR